MAQREDIKEKIRKLNPRALALIDEFDKAYLKAVREIGAWAGPSATVTVTEDMAPEEQDMVIFEGFLKEGWAPCEARKQTEEFKKLLRLLENTPNIRRPNA